MPALASAPRLRSVDPTTYAAFRNFSCGGTSEFEREVDGIVAMHVRGEQPSKVVRVAEASGELAGFCIVTQRTLDTIALNAAYIALIAISAPFRGRRLPDGGRISDLLLHDALEQAKQLWSGPPMPSVWAVVHRDNGPSHALFDRWGFGCIPTAGDHHIRYRPAGLGIKPARPVS